MSNETIFKSKTFRSVDCEVLDVYDRIKENLLTRHEDWNEGNVFEELVNRYSHPLKVGEEKAAEAERLTARVAELEAVLAERETLMNDLQSKLEEAERTVNSNAEGANAQQLEYESRIGEMEAALKSKELKDGQRVVSFVPDCLKAVEAVAARESQRRGQRWTVSHVINFFIHSRFINGTLNGDLAALSDGECRRLGISLDKKPSKMEVDL